MSTEPEAPSTLYEIRVSGQLNPERASWFGDLALTVEHETGEGAVTVLSGPVADRAALFGILSRIRDLGLYPKNSVSPERQNELERQTGQQYLAPARRAMNRFNYSQMSGTHTYAGQAALGESYPERIAALNLAGAGILLGTDALNPYQIPGYAAHEELAALVEAGLSPYEALRAGTRDAALALGRLDEIGTVTENKRADLLLLDANPLEDVAHTTRNGGVMLRGRWLAQSELAAMLDGLKDSFKPALLERLSPVFFPPLVMDGIAFLTLILPVILYFTLQESSPRQATWGKRKAGIRVASLAGSRLAFRQALVRSVLKFLPWQIAHTSIYRIKGLPFAPEQPSPLVMAGFVLVYVLVGIYGLSALLTKRHRTPYDWAAGSIVIVAT